MRELRGQVFWVAGAGGALARAVLPVFGAAGVQLVLLDRPGSGVASRGEPGVALGLELDLNDAAACGEALDRTVAALGRVDGLLHLAGAFDLGPLRGATVAQYERLMDANVRSLLVPLLALLPRLGPEGFVAAISGVPAWSGPVPGLALYGAAKAAAVHLLRALRVEPQAPRVCVVHALGALDTPANRAAMPDADPAGLIEPAAIAEALLFAATRPARGAVSELPVHPGRG